MGETIIPQLRQKFRLLVVYGHFKNLEDIATALGKKPGTIKSWADGSVRLEAGRIPKGSYENVVALFRNAIARHYKIKDIEMVLKGRVSDLEDLFKPPPSLTLSTLIEREAITDCGYLIKRKNEQGNLIEASNAPSNDPGHSVRQGEAFRIIFDKAGSGTQILSLQNAHQHWGFIPALIDRAEKKILIPGRHRDGSPANMREHHWTGLNRFIVLQSKSPFPRKIIISIEENLPPDSATLRELAEFYAAQPFGERKLFALSVWVEKNSE